MGILQDREAVFPSLVGMDGIAGIQETIQMDAA